MTKIRLKINQLKSYSNLPGTNELRLQIFLQHPPALELNNLLADSWPRLANISEDQVANIRKGAYYTADTGVPGLKLLVINTNFW